MGKNKNKLPDIMSKEQLVKLFEQMFIPKLSIACFTALMCGLRIREVCRLEVADIDLQKRVMKIRDSKNSRREKQGYGKDRYIPIPEMAVSPIKKWLEIIDYGKYFLPSEKSPDTYLRTKTLHIWFSEARERAGLNFKNYEYIEKHTGKKKAVYKFRFHHLRHFYATYVYEKTRDLYAVANLLGHQRIDTTQIYAKVSNKILKENIDFAFNTPIISQSFENNNLNTFKVPEIIKAKQEKSPVQILEERFARGEISAVDFQTAIRLLKVRKDYLNENENKTEPYKEAEHN
jgi:site-specific recombinase XerD